MKYLATLPRKPYGIQVIKEEIYITQQVTKQIYKFTCWRNERKVFFAHKGSTILGSKFKIIIR